MSQDNIPVWERGQEGGHSRPINVTQLFANLAEVCKVLEECDIRYWVSHGTMLGLYRDGGPIPWDDDADIGLNLHDRAKMPAAIKILAKRGYFIPAEGDRSRPVDNDNMPWYDTVFIRDGEKVEGWWFEEKTINGKRFYIYDEPRCGHILKHEARYYDELQRYECRGKLFYVPNDIEDWLVMMYGVGWKAPDRNKKYNHQG